VIFSDATEKKCIKTNTHIQQQNVENIIVQDCAAMSVIAEFLQGICPWA